MFTSRLAEAAGWLGPSATTHRRLRLHPPVLAEAGAPSIYLGYRVDGGGLSMGPKAKRRMRRYLARAARKGPEALEATLQAYRGMATFV